MEFILQSSDLFLDQLSELDENAKRIAREKLTLLKLNPFRFKRIIGYDLVLFRIRFNENNKEKRIIYLVDSPYIKILCILDRKNNYKDLKGCLKRLGYL